MAEINEYVRQYLRNNGMPDGFEEEISKIDGGTLQFPRIKKPLEENQRALWDSNLSSLQIAVGNPQSAQQIIVIGAQGKNAFERIKNGLDFIRKAEGLQPESTIPSELFSRSAYIVFDTAGSLRTPLEQAVTSKEDRVAAIKEAISSASFLPHASPENPNPEEVPVALYAPGAEPQDIRSTYFGGMFGLPNNQLQTVIVDNGSQISSSLFHHFHNTNLPPGQWVPESADFEKIRTVGKRVKRLQEITVSNSKQLASRWLPLRSRTPGKALAGPNIGRGAVLAFEIRGRFRKRISYVTTPPGIFNIPDTTGEPLPVAIYSGGQTSDLERTLSNMIRGESLPGSPAIPLFHGITGKGLPFRTGPSPDLVDQAERNLQKIYPNATITAGYEKPRSRWRQLFTRSPHPLSTRER